MRTLTALAICLLVPLHASAQTELDKIEAEALKILEDAKSKDIARLLGESYGREDDIAIEREELENNTHSVLSLIEKEKGLKFGAKPLDNGKAANAGDLIIFVSFSMPDELILDYMKQAYTHDARLVIKGPVDGDLGKTMTRMRDLMGGLEKDVRGVSMDHRLFEYFSISAVPAIILSEKSYDLCQQEACADGLGRIDKITGDVTVNYALEQFSSSGDNKLLARTRLE